MEQSEYIALVVFFALWYTFNPLQGWRGSSAPKDTQSFRNEVSRKVFIAGAIFAVVWYVLYGIVAAAQFLYWLDGPVGTREYDATLVLFLVNLLLNKTWPVVFFQYRSPPLAFAVLFLIFASAVAIWILIIAAKVTAAAWLFSFYLIWLVVAIVLSVIYSLNGSKPTTYTAVAKGGRHWQNEGNFRF